MTDLPPLAEETESTPAKRPLVVTSLALCVLMFSVWHGYRLVWAITLRETLQEYAARGGFLYPAISGGIWMAAGLAMAWGLWRGAAWSQKTALVTTILYVVWYWCDRLLVQIPRPDWKFALGATVFLLAVFYLDLFDPRTSNYIKSRTQRSS